jgi:hypothetical protein
MSSPISRVNKLTEPKPVPAIPANYTSEPEKQYHPEYWLYLVLVIAGIALLYLGGKQTITQYQASTGIVLTSGDIASVQGSNPGDITNDDQVTLHVVLTDQGASKFAAVKPNLPIYFKGHEIGVMETFNDHTVSFKVPLMDAAKIKLELKWKDN